MRENTVDLIAGFPDFKAPGFDIKRFNQRFREKNLIISARSKQIAYAKHWGGLSIKFALSGNEHYQTDHSSYAVNPSNFLILNKDTQYSSFIDSCVEVDSFTLNFSDAFTGSVLNSLLKPGDALENNVDKKSKGLRFVERLYSKDDLIVPLALQIHRCVNELDKRNDEIAELFEEIFMALLKLNATVACEIEKVKKIKASTRRELYKRLNNAKDFIDSCYSKEITLNSIASIACMNREYFIRQFKTHFHITPVKYLMAKRMEAARTALLSPHISVSDVCSDVGYSDLSSFSKLFKRYYQVSPAAFRKQQCCR